MLCVRILCELNILCLLCEPNVHTTYQCFIVFTSHVETVGSCYFLHKHKWIHVDWLSRDQHEHTGKMHRRRRTHSHKRTESTRTTSPRRTTDWNPGSSRIALTPWLPETKTLASIETTLQDVSFVKSPGKSQTGVLFCPPFHSAFLLHTNRQPSFKTHLVPVADPQRLRSCHWGGKKIAKRESFHVSKSMVNLWAPDCEWAFGDVQAFNEWH